MCKTKATVTRIKNSSDFYLVDHWGNNYDFGVYTFEDLKKIAGNNEFSDVVEVDSDFIFNPETSNFDEV